MGLFSSKPRAAPVSAPAITRDIVSALAATSEKEHFALTVGGVVGSDSGSIGSLPEIDFLSNALPATEKVLSVAHCSTLSSKTQKGVIALTTTRVVAVIGYRERGTVVGQPTVHIFPFAELTAVAFAPRGPGGGFGYFDMAGRDRVTLEIGSWAKKDSWWVTFSDRVLQEYNRSKF